MLHSLQLTPFVDELPLPQRVTPGSHRLRVVMREIHTKVHRDVPPNLEKPNLAPEEARDYAALRRWAHRFYPGTEPSATDFGYTAAGEPDPAAAGA